MEMNEKKDRRTKRLKKLVRKDKEEVITRRLNWDICFYDDIANNDGFIITEPATITLDGRLPPPRLIQSSFFFAVIPTPQPFNF